MWRPSSASGDTRQRREHDIKRQEKDDTITVKTYQNKLNSQSYSRLKMPTMAGRPTLFPSVEVSAFPGARSNVECQLSPGRSAGGGRRWEAVGERGKALEQRLGEAGRCATKYTQGTLALLALCSGVFGGDRKGASGQQRFWESSLAGCLGSSAPGCSVMSVRCGLRGPQALGPSSKFERRQAVRRRRCGFWLLSGRAGVKRLEGGIMHE